jgi:hypothetical protein
MFCEEKFFTFAGRFSSSPTPTNSKSLLLLGLCLFYVCREKVLRYSDIKWVGLGYRSGFLSIKRLANLLALLEPLKLPPRRQTRVCFFAWENDAKVNRFKRFARMFIM